MTLHVEEITASYKQGQHVITDLSFHVAPGEMILLLGHNGAGKTTLLNCVFGIHAPTQGRVKVDGAVLAQGTGSRLRAGVALVPAEHAYFSSLTVMENLVVAASVAPGQRKNRIARETEAVFDSFPVLGAKRNDPAGSLSGGQRRMLAVGMALTQRPRYLLMDEPSLGLAPQVVEDLYTRVAGLRRELNLGAVVVEQSVNPMLLSADRVHVVRSGRQAFEGAGAEFAQQDLWELL